jgi:DNA-binding NtrC family response regulator
VSEALVWVAEDAASQHVLEIARKVAETFTTILITGESGTGKDQRARLIHQLGPRRDVPHLKIDCASLPQELVESELFGRERGAFPRHPGQIYPGYTASCGCATQSRKVALCDADSTCIPG